MSPSTLGYGDANFDMTPGLFVPIPASRLADRENAFEPVSISLERRKWLFGPLHCIVTGEEGAGKTARRRLTQGYCADNPSSRLLSVFYHIPASARSWPDHEAAIAKSIAHEMIVQACERLDLDDGVSDQLGLELIYRGHDLPIGRLALCDPLPPKWELDLDLRFVVGGRSERTRVRFERVRNAISRMSSPVTKLPLQSLVNNALKSVSNLNKPVWSRVLLFIDNLDIPARDEMAREQIKSTLAPLFEHIDELGDTISVKAFLPTSNFGLLPQARFEPNTIAHSAQEGSWTGVSGRVLSYWTAQPARDISPKGLDAPSSGIGLGVRKYSAEVATLLRSDILEDIQKPVRTALGEAESQAAPTADDTPGSRLIVIQGGAGTGKTWLLQQIKDRVTAGFRTVGPYSITDILAGPSIEDRLRVIMSECSGAEIDMADLAGSSNQSQTRVRDSRRLFVLLDDFESLGNPPDDLASPDRQDAVREIKNQLIKPLLQLEKGPVTIIATSRDCSERKVVAAWLDAQIFVDALDVILLKNEDADVQLISASSHMDSTSPTREKADVQLDGASSKAERTRMCAGALSLARASWPWGSETIRALIDEMLQREPDYQRDWIKTLLRELCHLSGPDGRDIDRAMIEASATKIGSFPEQLRKGLVRRLVATGLVSSQGTVYRVYQPLCNLVTHPKSPYNSASEARNRA